MLARKRHAELVQLFLFLLVFLLRILSAA